MITINTIPMTASSRLRALATGTSENSVFAAATRTWGPAAAIDSSRSLSLLTVGSAHNDAAAGMGAVPAAAGVVARKQGRPPRGEPR